jgi:hypothetical protein
VDPQPQGRARDGARSRSSSSARLLTEELRKLEGGPGAAEIRYDDAAWLLDRLVDNDEFVDFLTETRVRVRRADADDRGSRGRQRVA